MRILVYLFAAILIGVVAVLLQTWIERLVRSVYARRGSDHDGSNDSEELNLIEELATRLEPRTKRLVNQELAPLQKMTEDSLLVLKRMNRSLQTLEKDLAETRAMLKHPTEVYRRKSDSRRALVVKNQQKTDESVNKLRETLSAFQDSSLGLSDYLRTYSFTTKPSSGEKLRIKREDELLEEVLSEGISDSELYDQDN